MPNMFVDENGVRRVRLSDMVMDETQFALLTGENADSTAATDNLLDAFRNGVATPTKRWDHGIVPIVFDKSVDDKLRLEILERFEALNKLLESCIKIRPYNESVDGVEKVVVSNRRDGTCSADIGVVRGKEQNDVRVSDADWCAIHEMFHAIGFAHEHTRPDRDDFIQIQWENLEPGELHDYKKFLNSKTFGEPYDYYSIMHYRPEFNQYTFKHDVDEFFMQRSLLPSRTDLRKVRKMYGCPLPTVRCDLEGYVESSPGLCIRVHREGDLAFRRAAEVCRVEGGRLYEPRDVKGFLDLRKKLRDEGDIASFWIGGTDTEREGTPRYLSDGLRMAFPTSLTPIQNNDVNTNCLSWDFHTNQTELGQFSFSPCSDEVEKPFICQVPERLGGMDIWGMEQLLNY